MGTYYKKSISRALLFIASSLSLTFVVGLFILLFVKKDTVSAVAAAIVVPILLSVFWSGYIIVKKQKLIISDDSITFHFYVFTTPKIKYNAKSGLKIFFMDIEKFYLSYSKGDHILTADTNHFHIVLKDGTDISFVMYEFIRKKNEFIFFKDLQALINKAKKNIDIKV